jgi:hypothetical protein
MDKEAHAKSDDPFGEEYDELDARVAALNAQAAQAAAEQNRALAAAQNAEIRCALLLRCARAHAVLRACWCLFWGGVRKGACVY